MELSGYVELAIRLVNTDGRRTTAANGQPVPPGSPAATRGDRLRDVADLRELLDQQPGWKRIATSEDVDRLRTLRDELRAVLEDAAVGEESTSVRRLNVLLGGVRVAPRLTAHDGEEWHIHLAEGAQTASEGYGTAAVLGVAFYLTEHGFDRVGRCESPPCRNVFVDTSTNRSRRYCSDRCATRANVAAFRARRRDASDPERPPADER